MKGAQDRTKPYNRPPRWYIQEEVAPNQWERAVPQGFSDVDSALWVAQRYYEAGTVRIEGPVWPEGQQPIDMPMRGVPQPRNFNVLNS